MVRAQRSAFGLRNFTVNDDSNLALLVADSFLIVDGEAIAIERHLERFLKACNQVGLSSRSLQAAESFFVDALETIPERGSFFPRFEMKGNADSPLWNIAIRTAPEIRRTARVLSEHGFDPRVAPGIKGPDILALQTIRAKAIENGFDDQILFNLEDFVIESTTSAVVWWQSDSLNFVAGENQGFDRIASVTEQVLVQLAAKNDTRVSAKVAKIEDLVGSEVWLVNALHGFRLIESWKDSRIGELKLELNRERIDNWQKDYEALRKPIGNRPE